MIARDMDVVHHEHQVACAGFVTSDGKGVTHLHNKYAMNFT